MDWRIDSIVKGFTVRLRRLLPFVGTTVLLGYLLHSTDLAEVGRALRMADLGEYVASIATATVLIWLYDTGCLVWLVRTTLGHRGRPVGGTLRELAPIKASSYVLNILNYHAASLGIAWLVSRRKGVSFIEATGALALLSYMDLLAVSGMVVAGMLVAPDVLDERAQLQFWLRVVVGAIFVVALLCVMLVQSSSRLPLLVTVRDLPFVRPLTALSPWAMLVGIGLRGGLVLGYSASAALLMRSFGMQPSWGRMLIAVPILTVVGTIPISVSGIGTTQVLMRSLYAPFVIDGRAPGPVVDAFSTAMIIGYVGCRLLIATPFFRSVTQELQGRDDASRQLSKSTLKAP
jgi:uncharacterized membrane protein YbhN (UPF0104 family)